MLICYLHLHHWSCLFEVLHPSIIILPSLLSTRSFFWVYKEAQVSLILKDKSINPSIIHRSILLLSIYPSFYYPSFHDPSILPLSTHPSIYSSIIHPSIYSSIIHPSFHYPAIHSFFLSLFSSSFSNPTVSCWGEAVISPVQAQLPARGTAAGRTLGKLATDIFPIRRTVA